MDIRRDTCIWLYELSSFRFGRSYTNSHREEAFILPYPPGRAQAGPFGSSVRAHQGSGPQHCSTYVYLVCFMFSVRDYAGSFVELCRMLVLYTAIIKVIANTKRAEHSSFWISCARAFVCATINL